MNESNESNESSYKCIGCGKEIPNVREKIWAHTRECGPLEGDPENDV